MKKNIRVAFIQYWLVSMRGGEAVLEALCRMFPQADIFTHCLCKEKISPVILEHKIYTSFIDKLPFSKKIYQYYLPLMPLALEQFVLRDYDLVISLESGPAKGVLVPASIPHLCYCHTPMRYLWDMSQEYLQAKNVFIRPIMRYLLHRMRLWDVVSSHRVDRYVANSTCVSKRIAHWWSRKASIVFPPVELPDTGIDYTREREANAPYVFLGQLVSYKKADLALKACAKLGRRIVIVGDGEQRRELETLAHRLGVQATFTGRIPNSHSKWEILSTARGLLFPGEEDFGIVPVESLACGCPVIGYGKGGLLDTVRDGQDGVYFQKQTVDSLVEAIQRFEQMDFDRRALRKWAENFAEERFVAQMETEIEAVLRGNRSPSC